jgi:hypothetical protein
MRWLAPRDSTDKRRDLFTNVRSLLGRFTFAQGFDGGNDLAARGCNYPRVVFRHCDLLELTYTQPILPRDQDEPWKGAA